jgi:hypothetical protein
MSQTQEQIPGATVPVIPDYSALKPADEHERLPIIAVLYPLADRTTRKALREAQERAALAHAVGMREQGVTVLVPLADHEETLLAMEHLDAVHLLCLPGWKDDATVCAVIRAAMHNGVPVKRVHPANPCIVCEEYLIFGGAILMPCDLWPCPYGEKESQEKPKISVFDGVDFGRPGTFPAVNIIPPKSKPLIYLAAPLSHPNRRVMDARVYVINSIATRLLQQGDLIFSPITHGYPLAAHGLGTSWADFAELDMALLDRCDRMHVLPLPGWHVSVGVGLERCRANETRKPIRILWGEVDSVLFCELCPEKIITGIGACKHMTCPYIVEG